MDDAAQTAKEREILSKIKTHLQREWTDTTKIAPTETEIISLLRLIHIQVLDVDDSGNNEREAKHILRASILRNPEQADLAWNTLLKICTLWSSDRNGGSRSDVEQQLLQAGIALKSPRSFQEDIERLKKYSERTFELLRPLSQIEINGQVIKMQRPVSLALRQVAEHESLVVVGEPGSGKSGVLHDLVEQEKNSRDVIFLAVDKLEVQSLGDLQNSLRLEHDFIEVLCNWTGIQPGFLVIDALDAARSGVTAQTFYDLLALIKEKAKHWRVVVSIRQYDLRHNTKLQSLFSGQPPNEFLSNEFLFLRHLNISRLNTEEWLQLASQSPELGQLFVKADQKLRELLLIPFNVQLMANLLERGILIGQLTPIKTQIELLNLYWEKRVDQPIEEKDAREILLSRAINEMVKARSLRVNRRRVATSTTDSPVLATLLKTNVLSEWSDDTGKIDNAIITFSHHVLFDYAVARLMLRDAPQSLVSLLKDDPDLNVAIRPSLIMHFEHEWMCDRNGFWQLVFSIINTLETPEIGKLIGPAVAVEAATDIDDFLPLIEALGSPQQSKRECAEKVYRHVIGALLAKDTSSEFIAGSSVLNWVALLDKATVESRTTTIYTSCPALQFLCNHSEWMTQDQRETAGLVARRLLDFALNQPVRNLWLVISGLETVCRTYESDPNASRAILRQCLEPEHVLQYGHKELFRFAQEIERLIPLDPQVVEEIYRAAFTLMDDSEESTSMGGSRILSLSSTRRQDFYMARFALAERYGKFMEQAPEYALRALIAAFRTYPSDRYSYSTIATAQTESFDFNGKQARIKSDCREIWADNGGYGNHEEPRKMLDIFEQFLDQIAADANYADKRKNSLSYLF